jgi:23S rRNA (guanosine2251-2'-O)-methyltransferase
MLIYGINPVLEALRANRVTTLSVSPRAGGRLAEVVAAAERGGVAIRRVSPADLDRAVGGGARSRHQGVVAEAREGATVDVRDLIAGAKGAPLIVVLDGIEDPHNLGAILRTVDAAGADGVVRQTRHAAALGGAAAKASAGAVSHVRIADVVNIARALEELKACGVWTLGLASGVKKQYDEIDLTLPSAVVVGAEGTGLRRLVRERCDWVASIPMHGHVESLNVSAATAIVLYEALRQRRVANG